MLPVIVTAFPNNSVVRDDIGVVIDGEQRNVGDRIELTGVSVDNCAVRLLDLVLSGTMDV